MKGDTIDIDRYVQHCLATETPAQSWVRRIRDTPGTDNRVFGQYPVVKLSEGFGITTFAYHSGGAISTMLTNSWNALRKYR